MGRSVRRIAETVYRYWSWRLKVRLDARERPRPSAHARRRNVNGTKETMQMPKNAIRRAFFGVPLWCRERLLTEVIKWWYNVKRAGLSRSISADLDGVGRKDDRSHVAFNDSGGLRLASSFDFRSHGGAQSRCARGGRARQGLQPRRSKDGGRAAPRARARVSGSSATHDARLRSLFLLRRAGAPLRGEHPRDDGGARSPPASAKV